MLFSILYIVVAVLGVALSVLAFFFPWMAPVTMILWIPFTCFMLHLQDKRRDASLKKNAEMLSEAGTAITDTLKVAFDNLKKVSASATKAQAKSSDHEARIHRIEQHFSKTLNNAAREETIRRATEAKESPTSRRPAPRADDGEE